MDLCRPAPGNPTELSVTLANGDEQRKHIPEKAIRRITK